MISKVTTGRKKPAKKKPAKGNPEPKNPVTVEVPRDHAGRPTIYTQDLVDEICSRLACGESMRSVARDDEMPAMATMFRWMREKPEFKEQYNAAKEESADAHSEDILDIVDNQVETPLIVDGLPFEVNGKPVMIKDAVSVAHARLRYDARKWTASKMKPKKYGDKIDATVSGPDGGPVSIIERRIIKPGEKSDE